MGLSGVVGGGLRGRMGFQTMGKGRPLSRFMFLDSGLLLPMERPTWPKRPVSVVIDSATYLLAISSPDIDNVAMSLCDI